MNLQSFYKGQAFDVYKWLGVHRQGNQTVFHTFAPNAEGVQLLLEDRVIPMRHIWDGSFYEATVEAVPEGTPYEYRIFHKDGTAQNHCDPYGFGMELRPEHRSVVREIDGYVFQDVAWRRRSIDHRRKPMNIYELHLGSWKKSAPFCHDWYSYEEIGRLLVLYLKENHYNYVELLPLSEHPCDESWGYQNTGYFAPTSRYGTPEGLMRMIDLLHQNEIGVILDFVPVHFAVDAYGLARYDGSCLYEAEGADRVSEWGSYNFDHSKGVVRSFLQSVVDYWLSVYHFDGIRMDAVSRLIYRNGDPAQGENLAAIEFLQNLNRGIKERHPQCILCAEDSSNYAGVTAPVEAGGLGFDYKWDMGWMNDTLSFFALPPRERSEYYHRLTFSMLYCYKEQFLLPLSHDENVHLKKTILRKMYGTEAEQFAQARAMYLYMMMHPGKKLHFMGSELAMKEEWFEGRELDWGLLAEPQHQRFHAYMTRLNQLYITHSAFYERDFEPDGFQWIECGLKDRCIYAMARVSEEEVLAAFFNLSEQFQVYYSARVQECMVEGVLLHTDWQCFGGSTGEQEPLFARECLRLPAYSGVLLRLDRALWRGADGDGVPEEEAWKAHAVGVFAS